MLMRRRTGRAQTPLFVLGWTAESAAWNGTAGLLGSA